MITSLKSREREDSETQECVVDYGGKQVYVVVPELLDHIENAKRRLKPKGKQNDEVAVLNEVFRYLKASDAVDVELLFELAVYTRFKGKMQVGKVTGLYMALDEKQRERILLMQSTAVENKKVEPLPPLTGQ